MNIRARTWQRFEEAPHRVSPAVFMDVFKAIFDTAEKQPGISLIDAAPTILEQLRKQ